MSVYKRSKGIRKYLTIEEKINLFERYLSESDEPIKQNTVYEGYPIGKMAHQIKIQLKRDPQRYDETTISRISELGLLEQKKEKIEDRINRLIDFVKDNPEIWYYKSMDAFSSGDNEEYKRIKEQLKIAEKDYGYIRIRTSIGKVKEEEIEKLKNARVGGVFGVPRELEELSEKYNIDIRELQTIEADFGSVDAFRKAYCEYFLYNTIKDKDNVENIDSIYIKISSDNSFEFNNKTAQLLEKHIEILGDRLVKRFDISKDNFMSKINNYENMLNETLGMDIARSRGFVDAEEIIVNMDELLSTLSKEEETVLRLHWGLGTEENGKIHSFGGVAKKLGHSRERSRQIQEKALSKLRHPSKIRSKIPSFSWGGMEFGEYKNFVREYFENYDVFYSDDKPEIEKEKREKIKQNYYDEKNNYLKSIEGKTTTYFPNLEELNLSKRVYNSLKKAGYKNFEEILSISEEGLYQIRSLGETGIREITEEVYSLGYKFNFDLEKEKKEKKEKEIYEMLKLRYGDKSIEEMNFTFRCYNSLKRCGCNTVDELIALDREGGLSEIKHLGKKSLKEIYEKISELKQKVDVKEEDLVTVEESNIDDQLVSTIDQLQVAYADLKRQADRCEELRTVLTESLEKIKSEKVTSVQKLEKLIKMVEKHSDFLRELEQLEIYEQKIQQERNILTGKGVEEKDVQEQLDGLDNKEQEIAEKKEKIKRRASEMDFDL